MNAIREQERVTNRHLPIIALTARASKRDRERCLAAGMDDFVSKPIEAEALWAAVARIVAALPRTERRGSHLLDPAAIRRACGGEAAVFDRLGEVFRRSLPDQVMQIQSARHERDLSRMRETAHNLYSTLGAFSTIAGALALNLEDSAIRGDVENCAQLVDKLESVCGQLVEDTRMLTLDDLRS